jgi:hypothetical protein
MIKRREFLEDTWMTLVLVPLAEAGCASQGGNGCNGVFSTSSVAASHTHTVCVAASDLANPPSNGATYTTSSSGDHTHQITLTAVQLQSINGAHTVSVVSTNASGHTHTFSILKTAQSTSGGGHGW